MNISISHTVPTIVLLHSIRQGSRKQGRSLVVQAVRIFFSNQCVEDLVLPHTLPVTHARPLRSARQHGGVPTVRVLSRDPSKENLDLSHTGSHLPHNGSTDSFSGLLESPHEGTTLGWYDRGMMQSQCVFPLLRASCLSRTIPFTRMQARPNARACACIQTRCKYSAPKIWCHCSHHRISATTHTHSTDACALEQHHPSNISWIFGSRARK